MVNGPDRVFIEKQGFLQQVPGVSIGEKSLIGRRQEYRPASWRRHLERSPFSTRAYPMAAASPQ